MDIGSRIKQARLESGVSQRALCDGLITRNMLSLMENGRAKPGMDTLAALAERLGKPVSWFLEEKAVLSPNQDVMARARVAYGENAWAQVLSILVDYKAPDGLFDWEMYFLEAVCRIELAARAIDEGRDVLARELLELAGESGEKSPYFGPEQQRRRVLLLCRADPAGNWAARLPALEPELLARAEAAYRAGEFDRCGALLDAAQSRDAHWFFLRGKALVKLGAYADAAEFLRRAEGEMPGGCAPLLEVCYRELGDYKRAYEYACKQREN